MRVNRRKRAKENQRITGVLVGILVGMLLLGGGVFCMYVAEQNQEKSREEQGLQTAQEEYEDLQENVITDSEDPLQKKINFEMLKEKNPDVYAWIWIPGTNIDYPILQSISKADDYYLNTTIDGKEGYPGAIYTEKYNSQYFVDPVTIIYGHELKDGTMFSQLHKYEDKTFFDEYPYVYIYHPEMTLKYQIFAAVAFDDRYILGSYNFQENDDFQKYLDELMSSINGNVNRDVSVTQETTILTLSTCISDYPERRWLVNATLVDVEAVE